MQDGDQRESSVDPFEESYKDDQDQEERGKEEHTPKSDERRGDEKKLGADAATPEKHA